MVVNILTFIGEGGFTLADLNKQIGTDGDIQLNVASPGGDVAEADMIYSELVLQKKKGRKIYAYLLGEVASAASYLIMAADEIIAMPQARIMIHNAWGGTQGNAQHFRAAAERFERIDQGIAAIYATKTKREQSELLQMMAAETWMTAEEAMQFGFVDRIETVNAKAISFDKVYAYFTEKTTIKPKTNNMNKTLRKALALFMPDKVKNVYDELADGTVIFVESEDGDWTNKPVFVEGADGEMTPAPDGTHDLRDGRKIVVAGGVITEVMAAEPSAMETENQELKNQIAALQSEMAQTTEVLALAMAKIEQLEKPAAKPANQRTAAPAPQAHKKDTPPANGTLNVAFFEQKYGKSFNAVLDLKAKLLNNQ